MKIHILFPFSDTAWGGGNQFLKALRKECAARDVYTENIKESTAILVNSHHELPETLRIKEQYPEKHIIHRIDGPVTRIRQNDTTTDKSIAAFNAAVVDGTIFQSEWSKQRNMEIDRFSENPHTVIYNAPDPKIFFPKETTASHSPIRIIATSWSDNWKKGFAVYEYLDKHINTDRYHMTFVGNSPIAFENITHLQPLNSEALATLLREQDIYITASQQDPCSNALIEALACGLPAVVLGDGGHPELIGEGGALFHTPEEALKSIERVADNYALYRQHVPLFNLSEQVSAYLSFIENICTTPSKQPSTALLRKTKRKLFMYSQLRKGEYLLGKIKKQRTIER